MATALDGESAALNPNRFHSSVLYASFGTTFCLRANQPERYMSQLAPEERVWVHHMYGDSKASAAEYGYDPSNWWTFLLPATVCQRLGEGTPPERLKEIWFPGDQPRVNPHGGDGCPSGPTLSAAWQMNDLYRFLDRRVSTMLEPHPFGGEQPGNRPIVFIGSLFPGSSHGPGVTIPTLVALDHILKTRHLLPASQRVLFLTLPDFADGISESRLQQQRANAMGFLLALDALHSKVRREGAVPFRIGDMKSEIRNQLVDEVFVFGGQGKAGFLSPTDISRVVAHCSSVFGAQGTGVGHALEDHAVRLRQVKMAGAGNHSMFFGRLGVYEIRLDRELAARRLGERCALEAVKILMAPRGEKSKEQVPVLVQHILGGQGPDEWIGGIVNGIWPLSELEVGKIQGDLNLEYVTGFIHEEERRNRQAAEQAANRFGRQLVEAFEQSTDRGLLDRLLEGHLESLGTEMEEAHNMLRGVAEDLRQRSAFVYQDSGAFAMAQVGILMNAVKDENRDRQDVLASFSSQISRALGGVWVSKQMEVVADILTKLATKFSGRINFTVKKCLERMAEAVKPQRGFLYRKVIKDVDWSRMRKPMPTLEILWSKEIEDALFYDWQPLLEQDGDGNWRPKSRELRRVLLAEHSGVAEALRRGEERVVIRELESHFTRMFAARLDEFSFSSFAKTFLGNGDLKAALRESLESAYSFAYGWAMKYDDVDEVERQTIVEVPHDDPEADALFLLAESLAPENLALRRELGYRGKTPAVIIAQAAHGYTLPNLARFGENGEYHRAFTAQYRLFRQGRSGPVLGDRRFEQLIAEEFEEWRPLLSDPGGRPER